MKLDFIDVEHLSTAAANMRGKGCRAAEQPVFELMASRAIAVFGIERCQPCLLLAALKAIISDRLAGEKGRAKSELWVPQWMAFPPSAYTARGGVGSVKAAARVAFDLSASIAPLTEDSSAPETDEPPLAA